MAHEFRPKDALYDEPPIRSLETTRRKSTPRLLHTPTKSSLALDPSTSLYTAKLESRILELQQLLETQHSHIRVLTEDKKCLQKICTKQHERLHKSETDLMMIEELSRQIEEMKAERKKMMEVVDSLGESHQRQLDDVRQETEQLRQSNSYLEKTVREFMADNKSLDQIIVQLNGENRILKEENGALQDQLYEKRNIQRKYRLCMQESEQKDALIEELRKKLGITPNLNTK